MYFFKFGNQFMTHLDIIIINLGYVNMCLVYKSKIAFLQHFEKHIYIYI